MRSARYAFRVLIGPWGSIALAGLEIASLLQLGSPWRGEVLWTTEWMAIALFLAGPMLAGLAAVDAARMTRKGALPLLAAMGRPRAAFWYAAVWTALPASLIHALAYVVALLVGGTAPNGAWPVLLLGFLVQIASVWWYVALGSAIGRFVTPLAAGIVATLASLGAFYVLSWGNGFLLLDFGAATISRIGLVLDLPYLLLQLAAISGTTVILTSFPVRSYERRFEISPLGLLLLAVLLGVLIGTRIWGPEERTQLAASEPPETCYWLEPTICLFQEHERVADATVGSIMELVQAARDHGYDMLVPTAVHESSWAYNPHSASTRGFRIPPAVLAGDQWDLLELAQRMLIPAHCPRIFEDLPPPESYFMNVEALMFTWISLVENPQSSQLADVPKEMRENVLSQEQARDAKSFVDSCDF